MPAANGTDTPTKKETEDLIRAILDILNSQMDKRAFRSLTNLLDLLLEHVDIISEETSDYLAAMMAELNEKKDASDVNIRTVAGLKSVLNKELKKLAEKK